MGLRGKEKVLTKKIKDKEVWEFLKMVDPKETDFT